VVTDSEYIANVPLKGKQLVTHLIYSNSKQILEQQIFIFEMLCEKPITALWLTTFGISITKHFVVFCVVSCVVFLKQFHEQGITKWKIVLSRRWMKYACTERPVMFLLEL
jgi:hypothetical protein